MKFPKRPAKLSFALISIFACFALLFSGCTVTKKLTAADILSKTKLEFASISIDSVFINEDLFPKTDNLIKGLLPNPQVIAMVQDFARGILEKEIGKASLTAGVVAKNHGQDTLWIRGFSATLMLDSLMELPLTLKDSVKLIPGNNAIEVSTQMPVDRRIFSLMDVQKIRIVGHLDVAVKEGDETLVLDFDMDHAISQEEKQALADRARTSVLNSIVSDWVGAIKF